MADRGALIISWGEGQPGVAQTKALAVFGNALGYYEQLQKEGRIDGYRVYASLTGKNRGQLVIDGAVDELAKVMVETESQKQRLLGELVAQDLEVQLYVGGSPDEVTSFFMTGLQAATEAGLAS